MAKFFSFLKRFKKSKSELSVSKRQTTKTSNHQSIESCSASADESSKAFEEIELNDHSQEDLSLDGKYFDDDMNLMTNGNENKTIKGTGVLLKWQISLKLFE